MTRTSQLTESGRSEPATLSRAVASLSQRLWVQRMTPTFIRRHQAPFKAFQYVEDALRRLSTARSVSILRERRYLQTAFAASQPRTRRIGAYFQLNSGSTRCPPRSA